MHKVTMLFGARARTSEEVVIVPRSYNSVWTLPPQQSAPLQRSIYFRPEPQIPGIIRFAKIAEDLSRILPSNHIAGAPQAQHLGRDPGVQRVPRSGAAQGSGSGATSLASYRAPQVP